MRITFFLKCSCQCRIKLDYNQLLRGQAMKMKSIILLISSLIVLVSCSKNESVQRSIDSIYIYHCSESSIPFAKYKIDFTNKEFTILVRGGFINMTDEVKEDSPIVKTLDADSINTFLSVAGKNGFEDWEESYVNYNVDDGHEWNITISFSDGTEKEIKGSNAYPKTWNEMYVAFETLTSENILHWKSE